VAKVRVYSSGASGGGSIATSGHPVQGQHGPDGTRGRQYARMTVAGRGGEHEDASSDLDEPMASQSAGDSEAGVVGLRHNNSKSNFFSPSSGGNSSGDERAGMLQQNSRGSFKVTLLHHSHFPIKMIKLLIPIYTNRIETRRTTRANMVVFSTQKDRLINSKGKYIDAVVCSLLK